MNFLILGRGKTGGLVAEVAAERKHRFQVAGSADNPACAALTAARLQSVDAVIDFTTPHVVLAHIEACVKAGKNMVVGTTGWYKELDRVRALVERHGTGFVYAPNFSIGVNLFLDVARTAAAALHHDYAGQIFERHHVHKKDAPSGTAIAIQHILRDVAGQQEGIETGMSSASTRSSSNPPPTASTSAMTPNPAAASPKAPSAPPNGSPGRRASTTSKMCGGNCEPIDSAAAELEKGFARREVPSVERRPR
jgi:4-hydroxy-tetrahydrodipicolinate reductase